MEMYLDNCSVSDTCEKNCNCTHFSSVLNYFFVYKIWYLKRASNKEFFLIFILEDPPILPNYESLLVVTERQYNKFYLQIERSLLDGTNGPVTHIGVLVTKNPAGGFLFLFLMSVCIAIMVKVFLFLCICFMWLTLILLRRRSETVLGENLWSVEGKGDWSVSRNNQRRQRWNTQWRACS